MRFRGTAVFDGEDFEDLVFSLQHDEGREVSVRCSCTWAAAAAAANGPWQEHAGPLLARADAQNVLDVARRVNALFQERMRTMVHHPRYGTAEAGCPRCGGSGREIGSEYAKFDDFMPLTGAWVEVVTGRCRTAEVWPWSDDLWLQFSLLCSEAGVPQIELEQLHPPGTFAPVRQGFAEELDAGDGIVAVERLLEYEVVPDTLVCVDPSGRWLEREEVEFAEDLASWHGRVRRVLIENPTASAVVVEFHA
jgi:hypothetical protein